MVKRADKYAWHVGSPPPKIDPHSLVKHQLVSDYLARYIQVLMSNYLIDKLTLSIVDGFAGGGEYLAEDGSQFHDGSPLIALKTVHEAEVALNVGRDKPRKVDAKFYFVEKLASNFGYLDALLGTRLAPGRVGKDVVLLKQAFQDAIGPVMADIASRAGGERAIFLLDQYAYDQVPGPLLRTIFSQVKGAEVILTFNVDSLIAFLSDKDQCRAKLQQIGLDRYIDWRTLESLKNSGPAAWRSAIQRNLARGLVEESGARHHTIFYITPAGSTSWTYWLVHLSNSFKARDVMMELHWQQANHFSHYLEPDIFTLGYRTKDDEEATRQNGLDLGHAFQFDAIASNRCKSGLSEKLVPLIFDSSQPLPFSQLLDNLGSSTPATADMIRSALDPAIRSGDLSARSRDGKTRTKGSSLHSGDVLAASAQRPFFFVPRADA
jgi:three-Cys-motif partner protein